MDKIHAITKFLIYIGIIYASTSQILEASSTSYGGATLKIEWTYENHDSKLENGKICDSHLKPKCDVFFTLCLSNGAAMYPDCSLLEVTTKVHDNSDYLEFKGPTAFKVHIPQPVPLSYQFEMDIYDNEFWGKKEEIAHLKTGNFELRPTNMWTNVLLTRSINYGNEKLRVNLRMLMKCLENFYGDHCAQYCQPSEGKYKCTKEGKRECIAGLTGLNCDKEDSCYYEKCAKQAECFNQGDGMGRICKCNGGAGPECYPDYDPCKYSPCAHNGICTVTEPNKTSFTCNCTKAWTGHRCQEKRSACEEEVQKLKDQVKSPYNEALNDSWSPTVCLNGGTCLDHPEKFEMRCICKSNWSGERCETPLSEDIISNNTMLTVIVLIGAIIILMVSCIFVTLSRRNRRLKKAAYLASKQGSLIYYHHPESDLLFSTIQRPYQQHQQQHQQHQFYNDIYGRRPNVDRIVVQPASKLAKNTGQTYADEYDECDPLGITRRSGVYDLSKSSICSKGEEVAPPLPLRPENMVQYSSRPSSSLSLSQEQQNPYEYIPSVRNSPALSKTPTVYRPLGSAIYQKTTAYDTLYTPKETNSILTTWSD